MSQVEIDEIPFEDTKTYILDFIESSATGFIGKNRLTEIEVLAAEIMQTGIKKKDATHLACAIISECGYFITTDKRVLKYKTDRIHIVNPIKFIEIWRDL
jgi:predicted nucleic acid-binding protein